MAGKGRVLTNWPSQSFGGCHFINNKKSCCVLAELMQVKSDLSQISVGGHMPFFLPEEQ